MNGRRSELCAILFVNITKGSMALDFIPGSSERSVATYILTTGTHSETEQLNRLIGEITGEAPDYQVMLIDVKSPEGERLRNFYTITPASLPVMMIIAADDSIIQSWEGQSIPSASDIVYHLRSASNG